MTENPLSGNPFLLDERSPAPFRQVFGRLLARSSSLDTAIVRIRLSGVDLSDQEVMGLDRLRILIADINAQTLEEEAFALLMDPSKRETLRRLKGLLRGGSLELRSAPLAGWSPDFSIFSGPQGPHSLLIGLHWIQRPFPHRGPAWMAGFGPDEAQKGLRRFQELWAGAYEIGPAILKLLERATSRWESGRNPEGGSAGPGESNSRTVKTQGAEGGILAAGGIKPVDTPTRLG